MMPNMPVRNFIKDLQFITEGTFVVNLFSDLIWENSYRAVIFPRNEKYCGFRGNYKKKPRFMFESFFNFVPISLLVKMWISPKPNKHSIFLLCSILHENIFTNKFFLEFLLIMLNIFRKINKKPQSVMLAMFGIL